LLAYEHRIESRLYRAIAELKKMQAIRRERKLNSLSDTQNEEMIDERREMMDEEEEIEEVCNEEVSLNEAKFKGLTAENAKSAEKMKMDSRLRGNDKMGNTATSAAAAVKKKNEPNLIENPEFRSQETEYEIKQHGLKPILQLGDPGGESEKQSQIQITNDYRPTTNDLNNIGLLQN
jgi:hypothetical protein